MLVVVVIAVGVTKKELGQRPVRLRSMGHAKPPQAGTFL